MRKEMKRILWILSRKKQKWRESTKGTRKEISGWWFSK